MGANARVARIIAEDDITQFWRTWASRKYGTRHWLVRWGTCPWCCGFWTSLLVVTPVAWFPVVGMRLWWLFPLAVLAVAHAGGRLNHHHGSI